MISLDCEPGVNTFHVLPYSAGLPAAAKLRITAAAPYPTLHDLLGLRAWSEYFPCLALLSWYFQLLLHDILGLQAWSEYFPCLTQLS